MHWEYFQIKNRGEVSGRDARFVKDNRVGTFGSNRQFERKAF